MFLRDHWYVACASSQLSSTQPKAVQILDLEMVVFRDGDGQACALEDRCAHRQVKLSKGRMQNGNISCGYHGWEYDGAGNLLRIPSLTRDDGKLAPKKCVKNYPVYENSHYLWVWIAGESEQPTYQPSIRFVNDEKFSWVQESTIWQVNAMSACENQLDVGHTAFAHAGVYPGHESGKGTLPELREVMTEVRLQDLGVEVFSPPLDSAQEKVDDVFELPAWGRYELPFRNYVLLNYDKIIAIYNFVPLAQNACRLEFMYSIPGATGGAAVFSEGENLITQQDRVLLETAQPNIDRFSRDDERNVLADAPQILGVELTKLALKGELKEKAAQLTQRKVFSYRA